MKMANKLGISLVAHLCVLVLLTGCALHKHAAEAQDDDEVLRGKSFVASVGDKMPMWDADTSYARLEEFELATVKADIAMATQADSREEFLKYVTKLHADWDLLCAQDLSLRMNSRI